MAADSHYCPECDNPLREADDGWLECPECEGKIPARVVENADDLQELAESDSPAAWVADALLGVS